MSVLVDADGLVYLAGFGVQSQTYAVVWEEEEEARLTYSLTISSKERTALRQQEKQSGAVKVLSEEKLPPTVEPLSHAIQILKTKLAEMALLGESMEIYIKGDGTNFRNEIATILPYKGNRDLLHKPIYYDELYQYLRDRGAVEVHGQEADDAVSIRAWELKNKGQPYVVCSLDKDLDQIEGKHYNYKLNTAYEVTAEDARQMFWQQVLIGDRADNIPGCYRMGAITAKKSMDYDVSDIDVWLQIVKLYEESMGKEGCPYAGMPAVMVALETARLVYMRRYHGEMWNPPYDEGALEAFEAEQY